MDELKELAKESGFKIFKEDIVAADDGCSGVATKSLQKFYELVKEKLNENSRKSVE